LSPFCPHFFIFTHEKAGQDLISSRILCDSVNPD